MIEDFEKDINKSLKEIQKNTCKLLEALKEETRKSLKNDKKRPWARAPQPVPQHPEETPLPGALTRPGPQDLRIPGVWSHQDLRVPETA